MKTEEQASVSVVGAGLNGLLAAHYLEKKGFKVTVYESSSRVGGKIQTHSTPYGLRESAANAFIANEELESLCEELGVTLLEKKSSARRRWIYREGDYRRWPFRLSSLFVLLRFVFLRILTRRILRAFQEERFSDWGKRLLNEDIVRYGLDPACSGVFASDARSLSASLASSYFFFSRRRKRGKLRGSVSPFGGMQEFVNKLQGSLENRGVRFVLGQGADLALLKKARFVVIATDVWSAQKILSQLEDSRAELLKNIPACDLHSLNVFYKSPAPLKKPGFGILFPKDEGFHCAGVLFNSHIFPHRAEEGYFSETWIYASTHGEFQNRSSLDWERLQAQDREKLFGRSETPVAVYHNFWLQALPLYGLELEKALRTLPLEEKGRYLLGNYLGEIGVSRFLHRAQEMAERLSQQVRNL